MSSSGEMKMSLREMTFVMLIHGPVIQQIDNIRSHGEGV